MKVTKKIEKLILEELWETAAYDNDLYNLLDKFARSDETHKANKTDNTTKTEDKIKFKDELFFYLSTVRNRNLITAKQQLKLKNTVVSFFGLSVGSQAALTWIMQSRAENIKIADPDYLSPSNLNRVKFGWQQVGQKKTELLAKEIQKINPQTKINSMIHTDRANVRKFIFNKPNVDLIVDAIDDLPGKIYLRRLAAEKKMPVLMCTDVGDNVMLDIERYDLNPSLTPFLGRIGADEVENYESLSDLQRKKLIIKIVGFEKNSETMLSSLHEIGDTLLTWPQLGATATLAAGVITTAIKKIILGEKIASGRYYISLDDILDSSFYNKDRVKQRKMLVKKVKEKFEI